MSSRSSSPLATILALRRALKKEHFVGVDYFVFAVITIALSLKKKKGRDGSRGRASVQALAVFSGPEKKSPKGYTPALYAHRYLSGAVQSNGNAYITTIVFGGDHDCVEF